MKKFINICFVGLIAGLLNLACTLDEAEDHEPPGISLPGFGGGGDGDDCTPPAPEPQSLATWLAAPTAVFVGTVDYIEVADDPYLIRSSGGATEWGSKEDCAGWPWDEGVERSVLADIHFKDVSAITTGRIYAYLRRKFAAHNDPMDGFEIEGMCRV